MNSFLRPRACVEEVDNRASQRPVKAEQQHEAKTVQFRRHTLIFCPAAVPHVMRPTSETKIVGDLCATLSRYLGLISIWDI
jgi:hypothetical protein